MENNRTKYALEVASAVRGTKTFSVNSYLYQAKAENNDRPLRIFDKDYSRYVFTIIDSSQGEQIRPFSNIRIPAISDLLKRSAYAFQKEMDAECAPKATGSSPAYTVKFRTGPLKGKTPAEILAESGQAGESILNKQYAFLKENLQKYPANKEIMDAIVDASNLSKAGKLEKVESSAHGVVSILKPVPKPLRRKARADGMCPTHQIQIDWHIGDDYPVKIEIMNVYCPVKESANGTIQPQLSACDQTTMQRSTFSMSAAEWNDVVTSIERNLDQFSTMVCASVYNDAIKANELNRKGQLQNA